MNSGLPARDPDELGRALLRIDRVAGGGLTPWIIILEGAFIGRTGGSVGGALDQTDVDEDLLAAALLVKRTAGQINVLVHVVGILVALPKVLERGEVVQSLSLGAGNTGRPYDLETDRQIAEFTFIDWSGRHEVIRQNKIFGDVVALASAKTTKRRVLYVNGTKYPLRFLENRRALSSVLKDAPLERRFRELYGGEFATVADYWATVRDVVEVVDLSDFVPALRSGF